MIITYQGAQSFKVQFGDIVLSFDPISKDTNQKGLTPWRGGADITLVSLNHPDMNGSLQTNRGEKESFVINGPGEYEIQGVFIKGLLSSSTYGGSEKTNTMYTVNLEGMNLCFLGALGDTNIPSETKEAIDGIDILFVPVGAPGVLGPAEGYKFAVSLEPSIIIPMNYSDSSLKTFLKEGGEDKVVPIEKLTVKKKDLEGKEGEIVVLKEQ